MERNATSLRSEIEASVFSEGHAAARCKACGEKFEQPLLAMVFSDSIVNEYYACPICLSKVASVNRQKAFEADEPIATEIADTVEGPASCAHHLGYLKQRPENTPIPEECLTCSKIIDCMY